MRYTFSRVLFQCWTNFKIGTLFRPRMTFICFIFILFYFFKLKGAEKRKRNSRMTQIHTHRESEREWEKIEKDEHYFVTLNLQTNENEKMRRGKFTRQNDSNEKISKKNLEQRRACILHSVTSNTCNELKIKPKFTQIHTHLHIKHINTYQ